MIHHDELGTVHIIRNGGGGGEGGLKFGEKSVTLILTALRKGMGGSENLVGYFFCVNDHQRENWKLATLFKGL